MNDERAAVNASKNCGGKPAQLNDACIYMCYEIACESVAFAAKKTGARSRAPEKPIEPSLKLGVCSQLLLLSTTPMTASPFPTCGHVGNGTRFGAIRGFKKSSPDRSRRRFIRK